MAVWVDLAPDLAAEVSAEQIERDAAAILAAVGRARAELSVVVAGDRAVADLNREWRGKDHTTDVLSFPQDGVAGPVDVLGDVVINAELAARQGAERGHGTLTEIRVLLVHGVAHLLGYDHHTGTEAVAMRTIEARLLGLVVGPDAPAGLVEAALGSPDGRRGG